MRGGATETSTDRAERELERLVEKRSPAGGRIEDEEHELWRASAARHAERLREAARAEWSLYHEHMAEVHTELAVEHRTKAARLAEEGRGSREQGL